MNLKLSKTQWIASAVAAALVAGAGGVVVAQDSAPPVIEWDKRRLERLERNVRKLEAQLARANRDPNAVPTIIEPDPEVIALQSRVDDLTQRLTDMQETMRRVNAQLETTTFELAEARRDQTAALNEVGPLRTRIAELEARLVALEQGATTAAAGSEVDPQVEYDAAMKLAQDGAASEAIQAFEAFVKKYPDAAQTGEAYYRLGELYYNRDEPELAVASYAKSLRGWPTTRWAAEGTLKLATSLANLGRNRDACGAVAEFERRYAASSSANARSRATAIKTRAKCTA